MSIPVVGGFGAADPDAAPATLNQLISQLNALLALSIAESITPYILQADVPDVDDQDKVWQRIDPHGRPFGTYIFWNGLWVLEPPPLSGQLGWFAGDPTVNFDANGKGIPGPGPVANDTYGWHILNGEDTVANFSDRFIICGRMDNVGITGWDAASQGWRTNVTGAPLTFGGAATAEGEFTADGTNHMATTSGAGDLPPVTVSTIPPFAALAMIQWVGYPLT